METPTLKQIVEGALLAADEPLTLDRLERLFAEEPVPPTRGDIREALAAIAGDCAGRGYELKEVASGWRLQVRQSLAQWIGRLWEERPPRYSRAFLETLALIAYRQPITRAEIEDVRGVTVSSNIIKTLLEREWIRVVGHKEVPGRPEMFGTTRQFLDYFNLQTLDELPTLAELRDLESVHPELELPPPDAPPQQGVADQDEIATMEVALPEASQLPPAQAPDERAPDDRAEEETRH
jgi:segregation and condensation protein B